MLVKNVHRKTEDIIKGLEIDNLVALIKEHGKGDYLPKEGHVKRLDRSWVVDVSNLVILTKNQV